MRMSLGQTDESFVMKRVKSGLSSGEGLIYQVRDPQYDKEPIREGGRRTGEITGYQDILTDPGEPDKRLFIIESEFASALTVMEREGCTLSPVLRDVWDHEPFPAHKERSDVRQWGARRDHRAHYRTRTPEAHGHRPGERRRQSLPFCPRAPVEVSPFRQRDATCSLEPYFVRFLRTLERARTRGAMYGIGM